MVRKKESTSGKIQNLISNIQKFSITYQPQII